MAKKTVIRRLCKELPVSIVQRAAALEEQASMGQSQHLDSIIDIGPSPSILAVPAPGEIPLDSDDDHPATERDETTETPEPPTWTEAEISLIQECEIALDNAPLDGTDEDIASQYDGLETIYRGMAGKGEISEALLARLLEIIDARRQKVVKPKRGRKASS